MCSKVQSWGLYGPRAGGVRLTSNHVLSCNGMGFFVQGKYHCTWRKPVSVLRGYWVFIQISFGILCETSLLLAFLVENQKKLVLAKGETQGEELKPQKLPPVERGNR